MKINKNSHIVVLILSILCSLNVHAQCLWRGAKMLSKGSIIVMNRIQYSEFDRVYDWNLERWIDFPGQDRSVQSGLETMVGYGVTDRMEVMAHLPVPYKYTQSEGTKNGRMGLGDIMLKMRIGMRQWKEDQHGFTLVGALRFASGDLKPVPALGDGTTDLSIGGIFSSVWKGNWCGHLKGIYWWNGENEWEEKIGDQWKMIAKMDRRFSSRWKGFLTYIHMSQSVKVDSDGNEINGTTQFRHYGCLGCIIKPLSGLNVRPKLTFPIAAKGGKLYRVQPCLDIWYVFKL